ncbi:MAG: N-acetylmuramoyl-L-alanine amidase [Candidatus Moranbacteria bacterium]|jgi:hypothetical protein|nr:N-acetylmuramoyl-L-alanine amidase [Candidatus Moranbacteria bacterium]
MISIPKKVAVVAIVLVLVASCSFVFFSRQKLSFGNDDRGASIAMSEEKPAVVDSPVVESPVAAVGTESANPETKLVGEPTVSAGKSETKNTTAEEPKKTTGLSVTDRLVSFGYENRSSRSIDTVIVHSSYDALGNDPYSVSGVIAEYKEYGVSAHYLIDRKGTIYRLVEDHDVAYHAGVSKTPDGRSGVNAFSIGIEVLEKDTDSPTSAQYESLRLLIASLKSKYSIKYVLGHSDIAPGRKTDPWGFDWKELKQ